MVAQPDPEFRSFGARQMTAAAQRAAHWNGRTQAFPGLGGPSSRSRDPGNRTILAFRNRRHAGEVTYLDFQQTYLGFE